MKNIFKLKKMLKVVALMLTLSMLFNLAACNSNKDANQGDKDNSVEAGSEADKENESQGETEDESQGENEDESGDVEGEESGDTEGETEDENQGDESDEQTGESEDENSDEGNGQGDEGQSGSAGSTSYPESGFTVNDPDNTRGLSETRVGFGCGAAADGKPHASSVGAQAQLDSYANVDALAWDSKTTEKIIYLTFDCGYEYNGNTLKILDILKEKDVKAAFFCTLPFLRGNGESAGRMINEGHIVGNHSTTHPSFPTISRSEMASELWQVHKWLLDNYNYTCSYFRPPMGEYSESSLELTTSVGYRSVLWSFAYKDWETANQPSVEGALQTMKNRLHPGEVMLLHSVSDSNVAALADFIDYARAQGYTFKTLDDYEW